MHLIKTSELILGSLMLGGGKPLDKSTEKRRNVMAHCWTEYSRHRESREVLNARLGYTFIKLFEEMLPFSGTLGHYEYIIHIANSLHVKLEPIRPIND